MWLKILISVLPVERIVAACFDYLLKKIEDKNTPELAKSVNKIIKASVAFQECADDPKAVGRASRSAISAWAKGKKTPNVYTEEKK